MHTSFDPTPREAVLFGRPEEYARAWTLAHPVTAAQRQAGRPVRAGPQDRTHPGEARHPQPSPPPPPRRTTPRYELATDPRAGRRPARRRGRWPLGRVLRRAGSRCEEAHTNGDRGSHTGSLRRMGLAWT